MNMINDNDIFTATTQLVFPFAFCEGKKEMKGRGVRHQLSRA